MVGAEYGSAGAAIANGDVAQGTLQGTFIKLYNHSFSIFNSKGAGNLGHAAILVGDDENGWIYYSKGGLFKSTIRAFFPTLDDFYASDISSQYDKGVFLKTTREQDLAMIKYGDANYKRIYFPGYNDCGDLVNGILGAAGFADSEFLNITIPNYQYKDFVKRPGWSFQAIHPKPSN